MSDEYPQPGDTIEVTWNDPNWVGKRLVVIECPENLKGDFCDDPSNAWFLRPNGEPSHFGPQSYKIVARANGRIVSDSDVDKSLKRQLNDNLKGVFT